MSMEKMYLITKDGVKVPGQPLLPGEQRRCILVDRSGAFFFRSKKQKPDTVWAEFAEYMMEEVSGRN